MFFILSTGRSGTTTIARSLNTIDGLYAVHEPAPELIRESSAYHYGKMTQEEIAKILTDTRKPLVDGSAYCESNQCLSLMIPALREVFPEARYVWLIRNAMDVVASTMQKQWYTGHSENNDNYENCSEIEKDWIDGRIRGDLCGEMSPEEWENMSRFAKCCWYWSYVNRVIKRELSGLGQSKHYVLLLEDIDEEYRKLVSWMGLKYQDKYGVRVENVARRVPYHWSEWGLDEWSAFEKWCGPLMNEFYPSWKRFTKDLMGDKEENRFILSYMNTLKYQASHYKNEMEKNKDSLNEKTVLLNQKNKEIQFIKKSLSWRITSPLRFVGKLLIGKKQK